MAEIPAFETPSFPYREMGRNEPLTPANAAPSSLPKSSRGVVFLKIMASLWLTYHVGALVIAPASVPPSPQMARDLWEGVGPYLQALNMNQGNHFFAPDPGASTLVGYRIKTHDGRTIEGTIPSRETWPRLLYHRHFMLTESLGNMEPEGREVPLLRRAMARQLLRMHQGKSIELRRITHFLATAEWVKAGQPLVHPDLFEEAPIGRYEWTDF